MTAVLPPRVALYDPAAVRDWLHLIHGESTGWAWIGSTTDFKGRTFNTADRYWIQRAGAYVDQLDRAETSGIYLRTTTLKAPPREGRGGDSDSLALPGLAADLDIAGPGHKTRKPLPPNATAAVHIIDETGLPEPSLWIRSGGGLYAWWLLDQPHTINGDLATIQRLASRWQAVITATAERLGWSYGSVGDLSRVLRIPGTVNRKPAMPEPRPCQIGHATGRRYSLANLEGALTDALSAQPEPDVDRTPYQGPTSRGDGLTPWHDFENRTDWNQILPRHGWTLHHGQGRIRYWVRPDKEPRDGFSASTGKDPARDRLWVFSDATTFEPNRPYTKFEAYAVLEHGGNIKAAGRELRRLGFGDDNRKAAA